MVSTSILPSLCQIFDRKLCKGGTSYWLWKPPCTPIARYKWISEWSMRFLITLMEISFIASSGTLNISSTTNLVPKSPLFWPNTVIRYSHMQFVYLCAVQLLLDFVLMMLFLVLQTEVLKLHPVCRRYLLLDSRNTLREGSSWKTLGFGCNNVYRRVRAWSRWPGTPQFAPVLNSPSKRSCCKSLFGHSFPSLSLEGFPSWYTSLLHPTLILQ